MKKFMIIPVVFFNMSTCMLSRIQSIRAKEALKKIVTPKYNPPSLKHESKKRSFSLHLPLDHKTIDKEDTSIKSFHHSFKTIIPPDPNQISKIQSNRRESNYIINQIRQDKIKELAATAIVFGLFKIDYCWLYQSIKNFFNPNTQTNEA